ncbi:MAG: AraC family transcriptional regulator ligand-binding domain-containing protein [Cyclobacteriaceae bacterium]
MNYISISLYRKVLYYALDEGMKREDLRNLPTPIDAIDNLQAVPASHFFELHELLDDQLGPGFAVRVGQQMKIEDYGVLGLSWRTCSWAGEIFDRCERYFKLLSNTYVFKVIKEGDVSRVFLYRDAQRRGIALSNEATFSAVVVVLRATTETDISPIEVSFKHGPPSKLDSHRKAFSCAVLFNQPDNVITYTTKDLEMRTAKADKDINQFLVERVEEETSGMELSPDKIVQDVESLITTALPSGIPSIARLSEHLGMSNRTLTRRLSEKGFTFRDLIKKSQEAVSKELLKNSTRSVAEIAFETGFSEQSAFNRAFKRWTGLSPVEFRKNK